MKRNCMYTGINKLAEFIKIVAKDVSKNPWKSESVGTHLSLIRGDNLLDEISVIDDSGYRAIIIGDIRGNISSNGTHIAEEEHKGYMRLYCENSYYDGNKEKWKYRCFPSAAELAHRLQLVFEKIPLIPLDKNNCDSEEFWYERRDEEALAYFSSIVKKYADTISKVNKTPKEIFKMNSIRRKV